MFTVDLEKKMIASKQKPLLKLNGQVEAENAIVAQVDDLLNKSVHADIEELRNAGLSTAIDNANNLSKQAEKTKSVRASLNNPRIFTGDEIKSIAVKYGLRFLPSIYYKGSLPNDLPQKIREFKELGLCQSVYAGGNNVCSWQDHYREPVYGILAPKESFNLQEKPKDPLFFAKLEDGTYYLIHKWGNDLSIWNYVKNIPCRSHHHFALTLLLLVSLWGALGFYFGAQLILITYGLFFLTWFVLSLANLLASMTEGEFYPSNLNTWNSIFKD